MNKKIVAMSTTLVLGVVILCASAFANAGAQNGYEAFKAALKNTKELNNGTVVVQMSLQNARQQIAEADARLKYDKEKQLINKQARVSVGGDEKTFAMFKQDGQIIKYDSQRDIYQIKAKKRYHSSSEQHSPCVATERLVDAVMGNTKDYVTLTTLAGGKSEINLTLSEQQVPPVVQAAVAVMVQGHDHKMNRKDCSWGDKELPVPKLTSDVNVRQFSLRAVVNEANIIESQQITAVLTGRDAQGQMQELTFGADFKLEDVNNTVLEKLDLTKVKTETINHSGKRYGCQKSQ